nr:MAG TPA: hypothetical protein [Caudoviricetes sp.]
MHYASANSISLRNAIVMALRSKSFLIVFQYHY